MSHNWVYLKQKGFGCTGCNIRLVSIYYCDHCDEWLCQKCYFEKLEIKIIGVVLQKSNNT